MIEHSAEIEKLAQALHAAQGLIEGVAKDRVNPHFKNRYATLEAVIDAAKPALQGHGIAFTQAPGALVDGAVEITTMLLHASGQWMRSTLHVPLGKRDAQGVGSAITYGCRYALMATLGLPPVDDDGEAASRPAPQAAKPVAPVRESRAQDGDDPFGLGESASIYVAACHKVIDAFKGSRAELLAWWNDEAPKRRDFGLTQADVDGLKVRVIAYSTAGRAA